MVRRLRLARERSRWNSFLGPGDLAYADRNGRIGVTVRVFDDASDAFEPFDPRWAERQGVFERRTSHRVLELVVILAMTPALPKSRGGGGPGVSRLVECW